MPTEATVLALLNSLANKVDGLSLDVAVLNDRRADNTVQDERAAALQVRVGALERDLIARDARGKVIATIIGITSALGGAAGGALATKALALVLGPS